MSLCHCVLCRFISSAVMCLSLILSGINYVFVSLSDICVIMNQLFSRLRLAQVDYNNCGVSAYLEIQNDELKRGLLWEKGAFRMSQLLHKVP